jgi:hypothetical protein
MSDIVISMPKVVAQRFRSQLTSELPYRAGADCATSRAFVDQRTLGPPPRALRAAVRFLSRQ